MLVVSPKSCYWWDYIGISLSDYVGISLPRASFLNSFREAGLAAIFMQNMGMVHNK